MSVLLALLLTPVADLAQPPSGGGKVITNPAPKPPPPDEFRSLVREVEEAYKAPLEVDKDVLDELRKQYRSPTPEREVKIFKEIRRLYKTTPEQEQAILREIRRAYDRPSPEQEERIFHEIRKGGRLPLGTVPASIQFEQAGKLFRRLDQDGDGLLAPDEMPDTLRGQRGRWDRNRDGRIDFEEYGPYYQAHLQSVSERVATGEIPLKLPKGAAGPAPAKPKAAAEERLVAVRAGKLPPGLPDWFIEYDTDEDGQVGLYEWRAKGRTIEEFTRLDANDDSLLTAEELLRFLAEQSKARSDDPGSAPAGPSKMTPGVKPKTVEKKR